MAYKIFTISSGNVEEGAAIENFTLKNAGVDIPAVIIGEYGRGRKLGVLPVANPPMKYCSKRGDEKKSFIDDEPGPMPEDVPICEDCGEPYSKWELYSFGNGQRWKAVHPDSGNVFDTLYYADISETHSGRPKLITRLDADTDDKIIVVMRTKIGFRGGNSHTGDRKEKYWHIYSFNRRYAERAGIPIKERYTEKEVREFNPLIMKEKYGDEDKYEWDACFDQKLEFEQFPGKVIVDGQIAQGDAGRMGSGTQLIALIPKGTVFRTGYSGRLYDAPSAHYYQWNGTELLSLTWDERAESDIF